RAKEPPLNMLIAMSIAAFLCVGIGVFPNVLYSLLPYDTDYSAYDTSHVLAQTQLLFFSALAFVWLNLRKLYPPELRSVNLDVDWLYRRATPAIWSRLLVAVQSMDQRLRAGFGHGFAAVTPLLSRWFAEQGVLSRATSTGNIAAYMVAALLLMIWLGA
ncbi:MAG: multicomponent Na+:H+ antiporter subunit D, partial [Bacteroidia bacterium]